MVTPIPFGAPSHEFPGKTYDFGGVSRCDPRPHTLATVDTFRDSELYARITTLLLLRRRPADCHVSFRSGAAENYEYRASPFALA